MYFTNPEAFEEFKYGWHRPYVEVEYPWYRPTDVFAILTRHYPRRPTRDDPVAAVVDPAILDKCVSAEKSLHRITEDFENELLRQAMRVWADVSYRVAEISRVGIDQKATTEA